MWKKFFIFALAGGLHLGIANAQDKSGDLAIIVGKNCSLDNVTSEDLAKIFRAEKAKDPDGAHYVLTAREAGSPERAAVLAQVYKMSEDDYSKFFLQATFIGLVTSAPRPLTGAAATRQFVSVTRGAISYVRASEADDSVKIIKVDGLAPGDPGYPLKLK